MAINLLGSLTPPKTSYGSLTPPTTSYGSLTPKTPAPTPNATSTVTKQPVYIAPMGVTAKTPTTNVSAPSTTLPSNQVAKPAVAQPAPPTPAPAAQGTSNGLLGTANSLYNPNAAAGQAGSLDPTLVQPTQTPNTTPPSLQQPVAQPYSATNVPTYSGLIGQAANVASQPSADYVAQQARANQYNDALMRSRMNEAQGLADNATNPIPLQFQQGRAQVLQGQYAQEQGALGAAFQGASTLQGAANTQQGLEQTGLLGAAGAAAPVQVSPGNYLQSPLGGGAASAAQGQQQGIQAATNWAIAQQNMAQGQDYQGQAQAISNALQTLAPIKNTLVPYIAENNLDGHGIPYATQQINKINAQTNPAAYATMEAAINEARSYAIQLLGSQSGANPTDVTNSVNSFNFDNFTPKQLSTFLDNLDALGQYRLSQAQSASQAGYSANNTVGTAAQGQTATPGAPLQSGGANLYNSLPDPVKGTFGISAGALSGVLNSLGASASSAVGSAAGTGIAAKVLGI